ncbi:MAG: CPBP family intramembrane glutamic endopeptidase [Chloroflexota bacterium]
MTSIQLRSTIQTYVNLARQTVTNIRIQIYVLFVFAVSWSYWVPEALHALGIRELARDPSRTFSVVAVWTPAIATLLIYAVYRDQKAFSNLISRLTKWRVGWLWYAIAIVLPIFMPVASIFISRLIFGSAPQPHFMRLDTDLVILQFLIPFLVYAIPNAIFAEIGWRGFLQKELDTTLPVVVSGTVVGIIWGLWRIPTWLNSHAEFIELLLLFLSIIKTGVLYAWLHKKAGGSLVPLIVLHAMINLTGEFIGEIPIVEPVMWIVVVWLIVLEEHGPNGQHG